MAINWLDPKIFSVVPIIFSAVTKVRQALPDLKGPDQQAAAMLIVEAVLSTSETLAGRDLINDADVKQAVRGVMDAVVALHNIIAAKQSTIPASSSTSGSAVAAPIPGVVLGG
jgi:hypothetical protein